MVWLVDWVITGGHVGVPEGDALGVGVAARVETVPVSARMAATKSIAGSEIRPNAFAFAVGLGWQGRFIVRFRLPLLATETGNVLIG